MGPQSRGVSVRDDEVPDHRAISRTVLADQVKDRLLEAILAGRYPPNSRIVETRVARELGTSQAPVREALRGLEALGLIEISPFRGARVRHPSASELLDAYVVRSELESLGARLAVPQLTEADLAELVELVDAMQVAARGDDRHAVAIADASFHARLVQAAHNATLERVWHALEPFSRTYITLVIPGGNAQWTADLHLPILDALRRRDPEMVVRALQRHFADVSARLGTEWSETGPDPAGPPGAAAEPSLRGA
jgi:DNA-binding GntR family transcriptional regulator